MNRPSATSTELSAENIALLGARFAQRLVALPSGAQVAIRECGIRESRLSVVLLHGISSGAASWLHTALAVTMADQFQVIAWDAPGYGESSPLAEAAPTDADYGDRLIELLDAMHIQQCVLVGHSLGALMACAAAAKLGTERITRVILISPAGGYGSAAQSAAREAVRRERRSAMQLLGPLGLAERIDQRLLSSRASATERAWVRWNTSRLHPEGYLQAVELLCASSLTDRLELAMPVEVHCGDADVVTTPDLCRAWAEKFGAPFGLIKRAGHASQIEQPNAVAQLISRALLQSVGATEHA